MQISLTPSDSSCAELYYQWRQDEEMKKYNPLIPSTIEDLRERLRHHNSDFSTFAKSPSYFWFIEIATEKVGYVSMQNINNMMLTAEISYVVSPHARLQGIATTAVRLISNKAFLETPLRKLVAYVHEKNLSSIKVLGNVGFKQEGLLREHYLINSIPQNQLIFGLLKKDIS